MIDVIIVNWNAGTLLNNCVESVIKHSNGLVSKIIIVDNGSSDGSASVFNDMHGITLLSNNTNLGFAKACNLGACKASSDFLLFLNPDAALCAETLTIMFNFMRQSEHSKIAVCGGQLIDDKGSVAVSCSRFPTIPSLLFHATGFDRIMPRFGAAMKDWDHLGNQPVDQIMGALFFVRRNIFEQLRGFDERFFVYYEEVDFSLRAKNLGWTSYFLADAKAFHAGGGTSRQIKAKRLFYSLRSRILYSYKHFGFLPATVVLLAVILVEPIARIVQAALQKRSLQSLKECLVAFFLLYAWLPKWILNRQTL